MLIERGEEGARGISEGGVGSFELWIAGVLGNISGVVEGWWDKVKPPPVAEVRFYEEEELPPETRRFFEVMLAAVESELGKND